MSETENGKRTAKSTEAAKAVTEKEFEIGRLSGKCKKVKNHMQGKKVCVAFRAHTFFERKENLEVQTTVSVAA